LVFSLLVVRPETAVRSFQFLVFMGCDALVTAFFI
jgi:hypothetical protein